MTNQTKPWNKADIAGKCLQAPMASPPGVHSKEKGRDMKDPGKIWFCFSLSKPHELSEAGLQSSIYHLLLPPLLQHVCSPGGLAVSSTCLNVTAFLPSCLEQAPHILYFGTGQAWGTANPLQKPPFSQRQQLRAQSPLEQDLEGSEGICWLTSLGYQVQWFQKIKTQLNRSPSRGRAV